MSWLDIDRFWLKQASPCNLVVWFVCNSWFTPLTVSGTVSWSNLMLPICGSWWDIWFERSGVDSGYVESIARGHPWTPVEAWGCWLRDLKVSWVDSGYVELIAWGRPWKSGEACGCRLVDLMVSWVGSDSESDGIVGVMTWVNPLKSDKAWGRHWTT